MRQSPTAAMIAGLFAAVLVAGLAVGAPLPTQAGGTEPTVERLSGPERTATAAEMATRTFEPGPETTTALVARADEPADALAGASLAGVVQGPVLLTHGSSLPEPTVRALQELEVDEALVLGGSGAIDDDVLAALDDVVDVVERVRGPDRYATAAAIAELAAERRDGPARADERIAFVASGLGVADALAAGPAAAALAAPLLLTDQEALSAPTAAALAELDVDRVVVLGGPAAVSEEVTAAIEELGLGVERLAGRERTATAAAVSDWLVDDADFDSDRVVLARGDEPADALAVAPRAGSLRAPVVLTARPDLLGAATRGWLADRCDSVRTLEVAGGAAAVGPEALDAATVAVAGCGQPERSVTVRVASEGSVAADVDAFRSTVLGILNDERGWSLGGRIAFEETDGPADVEVVLAAPDVVDAAAPVCDARFSCRVGDRTLINDVRWRTGAPAFNRAGGDRATYRRYLINHEIGHWLGLGHRPCGGPGEPAPVMRQQSISLDGCEPNGWPLTDERAEAADEHLR